MYDAISNKSDLLKCTPENDKVYKIESYTSLRCSYNSQRIAPAGVGQDLGQTSIAEP